MRPSDYQNQSLQPLEDESDPIPRRDPPQDLFCHYCFMGDAVKGDSMNERCLLGMVHKFHGDRWVTLRVVPRKGPE